MPSPDEIKAWRSYTEAQKIKTDVVRRCEIEAKAVLKSKAYTGLFLRSLTSLYRFTSHKNAFADFLHMVAVKGRFEGKSEDYLTGIQDFSMLVYAMFKEISKNDKASKKDNIPHPNSKPKK